MGIWKEDYTGIMVQAVSYNRKAKGRRSHRSLDIHRTAWERRPSRRGGRTCLVERALGDCDLLRDALKRIEPGPRIIIVSRIPQLRDVFNAAEKRGGRTPKMLTGYWRTTMQEMFGLLNGPHEGHWKFGWEPGLTDGFSKAERMYGRKQWKKRPHDGFHMNWPSGLR